MKKVTSHDVAKAAGVSQSAVSRAFTPKGKIAQETRKRIMAAATELGYHPNAFARSLVQQKSNIVGIVMGRVDNHFYPYVLELFAAKLREQGKQIMFFNGDDDAAVEENLLLALQYKVQAMIMTSVSLSSGMAKTFKDAGVPVILFNRYTQDSSVHAVICDNLAGGELAAKTLINAKKNRFAFIGGKANTSTNQDRKQGFVQYLEKHGKSLSIALENDFSYNWGKQAAKIIFSEKDSPDALFCASDLIAMGAIDSARAAERQIPEDLAIIGFDDIPAASWDAYKLTSIRQPVETMIDKTLSLLEDDSDTQVFKFSAELIERSTVR